MTKISSTQLGTVFVLTTTAAMLGGCANRNVFSIGESAPTNPPAKNEYVLTSTQPYRTDTPCLNGFVARKDIPPATIACTKNADGTVTYTRRDIIEPGSSRACKNGRLYINSQPAPTTCTPA